MLTAGSVSPSNTRNAAPATTSVTPTGDFASPAVGSSRTPCLLRPRVCCPVGRGGRPDLDATAELAIFCCSLPKRKCRPVSPKFGHPTGYQLAREFGHRKDNVIRRIGVSLVQHALSVATTPRPSSLQKKEQMGVVGPPSGTEYLEELLSRWERRYLTWHPPPRAGVVAGDRVLVFWDTRKSPRIQNSTFRG